MDVQFLPSLEQSPMEWLVVFFVIVSNLLHACRNEPCSCIKCLIQDGGEDGPLARAAARASRSRAQLHAAPHQAGWMCERSNTQV